MKPLIFDNPFDLKELNGVVHDLFFDVDGVLLDGQNSLIFPMQEEDWKNARVENKRLFFKQKAIPMIRTKLIFHDVARYNIVDTQKVGNYDISNIRLKKNKKGEYEIYISTGVPIEITIVAREFKAEYVRTDEILSWKKEWSLF